MEDLQQIPYNLNKKRKKNRGPDNLFAGIFIGLIFPMSGVLLLYFFWGNGDFKSYCTMFFDTHNYLRIDKASKVLSLSMITNLIPFFHFLNKKKYLSARGILCSMFIYGIIILLYKFVW